MAFMPPGSTSPEAIRSFRNAGFHSFEDVISEFLPEKVKQIEEIVVAMAGPVAGNIGRLTNLAWVIDGDALSERFDRVSVQVINDLTGSVALVLPD